VAMDNGRYSNNPLFTKLGLMTVVAVLVGGFAITPIYGQANPTTSRILVPVETSGLLCGSEEVQFSGNIDMVFHTTLGPDGKFDYTISHTNYLGVYGIDISGNKVVIADASTNIGKLRLIATTEFLTLLNGTLVTHGGETNTLFQATLHTVINANGEVKANVEHIETKCQGG